MKRRDFQLGVAACALAPALSTHAQSPGDWPTRPVRWVLSQPAGSGPDNVARVLASALQRAWGQAVVIDNKPGGQNTIGAQAAARSVPDGYSFYFATAAALVTNSVLFKQLPYDPLKDFVPVSFIGRSPFGVFVEGASPIASFSDLLARAKAEPDKINVATEGPKTFGGMTARLLAARAQVQMQLVSYPNVGVALQDVIGGHAQVAVADVASAAQLVRQGRLRMIAVTAPTRLPGWDAVPAVAETLTGFDMVGWFAVVAPTGTPAEVVSRASRDIAAALADADVASRIHAIGPRTESAGGTPEQLAALLRAEHARWAVIARDIGLLPE